MSSLRILHVVPYYEHAWAYGGIPRLASAMTRGLAGRGHQVCVYTTDACDATSRIRDAPVPAVDGLDIRVFPNLSNRLAYHWQFFTPIGLNTHLETHARAFDIAHLHACRNLPGLIASRELRRAGVPYVLSPNGTAPAIERRILAKHLFDWTVGRGTVSAAARIVASTAAERAQLENLGIPAARISVLPNPFDEAEFQRAPDGHRFRHRHALDARPLVLFLGKLTPRKGVDVLVKAFSAIAHPDAKLVIAGNDMGAGRRIDTLVGELGLQPRVRRIGLLKGEDRLDALAAADVVVYPSRDEVFGLVAIEALICGTPVVVCNDSGCGEIIAEVDGGLCVPYGDVPRLTNAIASILESQDVWRSRAATAGAVVRDRFGASIVCERLESLYRDVLREHKQGVSWLPPSGGRTRVAA
jgi:glycosyltransferase involved in cell wall biosynthesis